MIPQRILVNLVSAAYDPIRPDTFDSVVVYEDATACIKQVDDTLTISIPGTENLSNVLTDIDIAPFNHSLLGAIHAGFWKPVDGLGLALLRQVQSAGKVSIAGHSEGAARAGMLALWLWMHGIKVAQLSLYECPRFNSVKSRSILARMQIDGMEVVSTTNGLDPVVDVPLDYLPPFADPTELGASPGGLADLDPVAWHSMSVIVRGVGNAFP